MSGHSKWANIKHKKAKGDAAKANIFTKIGREIAIAVKQGGSDPNSNSKLKDVIAKARQNNIPNDNITRSIKKAAGELGAVNYEEMTYEGYGPEGVAFIVDALTDNKNRTAGEIRHIFDRCGGALGATGCVSYMFNRKGTIIIDRENISEEEMMDYAIEAGAEDIVTDDEVFEVYTAPNDFYTVRENLEAKNLKILSGEIEMLPINTVTPEKSIDSVLRLIDLLDENDDVQNVYHNAILPDDEEEE
ncbi:MAG: YebC/PmpR family DNA-binding transcriptional regulator [Christensenellales bacterium]